MKKKTKRSLFRALCALSIFAAVAVSAHAVPVVVGPPVFNPANGSTYYLTSPDFWAASQTFAMTLGGNLVTINDLAENQFLFATFLPLTGTTPSQQRFWIGFNDAAVEGTFVWVSGETPGFTMWGGQEPTGDQIGFSDYGEFLTTGWNDREDNNHLFAVVEVNGPVPSAVPEPATALLLGSSLAGLASVLRRRRNASGQGQ